MSDWNADLYRRFERERTRPADDLLARIDIPDANVVIDLGCGPGNSTELLARRFPSASITGIDMSDDMLESARTRCPGCLFEKADIETWRPTASPDLIYANAALQWVPAHDSLLPRLMADLAPGGMLAIQMPDNREEPSHQCMRDLAGQAPWSGRIAEAARSRVGILTAAAYYDLLTPFGEAEVWRTTYHHPMASAAAIVTWVSSTGLRPFIDPLPPEDRATFLARYEQMIDSAYPPQADGRRLLAFPRLFIVARRRAA